MKVLLVCFFGWVTLVHAQVESDSTIRADFSKEASEEQIHLPIRKLVVFPFVAPEKLRGEAEKAWWKVREELTSNKRFLIASKQFMIRKDIFTPRKDFDRATSVLLGKHLDADALITATLVERQLTMRVYSALTGSLLWAQAMNLSSSQPIVTQLEASSVRLIKDFISQIPYQGFVILDPLIGRPVFDENNSKRAKVEVAADARVERGDLVQWITVRETIPVYQNAANFLIVAEGNVVDIDRGILTIEIKRMKDEKLLKERSLVRIPKEALRLMESHSLRVNTTGVSPEIVIAEMKAAQPDHQKHKGLVSVGATLLSVLAFILLAF